MPYVVGTSIGRVREAIGDTKDDEMFSDGQISDTLAECEDRVGLAAARILRRILVSPGLIREKYSDFGRIDSMALIQIQRNLLEQARDLEKGEISSGLPQNIAPPADQNIDGSSVDAEGWFKQTPLDTYLSSQERR